MREIERDRKRRRASFCASQRVGLFFFRSIWREISLLNGSAVRFWFYRCGGKFKQVLWRKSHESLRQVFSCFWVLKNLQNERFFLLKTAEKLFSVIHWINKAFCLYRWFNIILMQNFLMWLLFHIFLWLKLILNCVNDFYLYTVGIPLWHRNLNRLCLLTASTNRVYGVYCNRYLKLYHLNSKYSYADRRMFSSVAFGSIDTEIAQIKIEKLK